MLLDVEEQPVVLLDVEEQPAEVLLDVNVAEEPAVVNFVEDEAVNNVLLDIEQPVIVDFAPVENVAAVLSDIEEEPEGDVVVAEDLDEVILDEPMLLEPQNPLVVPQVIEVDQLDDPAQDFPNVIQEIPEDIDQLEATVPYEMEEYNLIQIQQESSPEGSEIEDNAAEEIPVPVEGEESEESTAEETAVPVELNDIEFAWKGFSDVLPSFIHKIIQNLLKLKKASKDEL